MINNFDKRHLTNGAAVPPRGWGCKSSIYRQGLPKDFPAVAGGSWGTSLFWQLMHCGSYTILISSLRCRQRKERLVFLSRTVGTWFAGGKATLGFLQAVQKWGFDWFLTTHNWHILNDFKRPDTLLKNRVAL